jgi:uncharacterized small protein (DUF1192 family)
MADDRSHLKRAILQLERVEDHLEGVVALVPDLEERIHDVVAEVDGLKADLTKRRLEG